MDCVDRSSLVRSLITVLDMHALSLRHTPVSRLSNIENSYEERRCAYFFRLAQNDLYVTRAENENVSEGEN